MAFEGPPEDWHEARRTRPELLARAKKVNWYHTLKFGADWTTPGEFALDEFVPYYLMPASLEGIDCLDVGTGDGYWSFVMEQRGARRVVATDLSNYSETDYSLKPDTVKMKCHWPGEFGEPYRIAATLLGSKNHYKHCSVYDLAPQQVGMHDLVFSGSMLMHVFGPHLALQRMASISKNCLLITTETELSMDGDSLLRFVGHEVPYVHFLPSPLALANMLTTCGFERVIRGPTFYLHLRDRINKPEPLCHTAFIALKNARQPCIPVAQPQMVAERDRRANIEIVSAPSKVEPHQYFNIYVRIANASDVDWCGDGGPTALRLSYEMDMLWAGLRGSRPFAVVEYPHPVADLVPAGLHTVCKLVVKAPPMPGEIIIRPALQQNGRRFQANPVECAISVIGPTPFFERAVKRLLRTSGVLPRTDAWSRTDS